LFLKAIEQGKPVVTANKALLAEHGDEIFGCAAQKHVDVYFGASVGGGIPIIRSLREGLLANQIESIVGIVNGTCNYILTAMETGGVPFDQALKEAQQKGYAEADPGLDIDGYDTAHKAVILASLAYGFCVPMSAVWVEGIRGLSDLDIRYARDLGYRIKLLAVIKRTELAEKDADGKSGGGAIQVRVHPTLVPHDDMLASVSGVFNAVTVRGDLSGRTLYYGRGAGREPTAATVLADIGDVVRNLVSRSSRRVPPIGRSSRAFRMASMPDIRCRYYLRLSLLDRPGMLGRITSVLGQYGISIASCLQKEARAGEQVPLVIVTHDARERDVNEAMVAINGLEGVGSQTVRLRIEG
jgi:homoserine dehydrogenase